MEPFNTNIHRLVAHACGAATASRLLCTVAIREELRRAGGSIASRAEIAMALCLVLLDDLLLRMPEAADYVADCRRSGHPFVFDHGAVRTVAWPGQGMLPAGALAFSRVLKPLGFRVNGIYPLDRLGMTGHAWCHADMPEDIPQFFVSELHPERFSRQFQDSVGHVLGGARDPLSPDALLTLARLDAAGGLPMVEAAGLLVDLVRCFERHHAPPAWSDYVCLREESPEMAWIATEGHAFNHATDRVDDIHAVADTQRRLGRSIKDVVEISASGRIRQTAFRAAMVRREFRGPDGASLWHAVPGSFHEIISRDRHTGDSGEATLDLGFDAGNAQEIFRMTVATPA